MKKNICHQDEFNIFRLSRGTAKHLSFREKKEICVYILHRKNCAKRQETNFIYAHTRKIRHVGDLRVYCGLDFSLFSQRRSTRTSRTEVDIVRGDGSESLNRKDLRRSNLLVK